MTPDLARRPEQRSYTSPDFAKGASLEAPRGRRLCSINICATAPKSKIENAPHGDTLSRKSATENEFPEFSSDIY
jgi:hypothetical protein